MKHYYLLLLIVFLSSCKENEKERITQLVTEWQGKEIILPKNPVFTQYVTDTIDYRIPQSDYKVLVYIDSIGCTSCKLQLDGWKEFIASVSSVSVDSIPFLFFFHSKDYREIRYLLKTSSFDLPISIDKEDELNKLNQFPSDIMFQTFLLDKNNNVVVLGNPIHNLAVKELYLKQITGGSSVKDGNTMVDVSPAIIDLGEFNKEEKREAVFTLTNTGNSPLVIMDVATTCGCASPTFDKHPANVGEGLEVRVMVTPKDSGFFSETITVKCNTNQYVKLTIKGQVK
jgi:Protein of unknown function (DUF1573).